jgi:hypothetical protein
MKRHRREEREIRDRRRKQVLKRLQEDEWKEQWQYWTVDDETISEQGADLDEDRDGI